MWVILDCHDFAHKGAESSNNKSYNDKSSKQSINNLNDIKGFL